MHDEPKVLFTSDAARVRLMVLAPGETGARHFHTVLHETVICVEGEIALFVDGGDAPRVLGPGQQASVVPPRVHWLRNVRDGPAKYLLIQSGGAYDFCTVPD